MKHNHAIGIRRLAAMALCVCVAVCGLAGSFPAGAANSASQIESQLKKLEQEQAQIKNKIKQAKNDISKKKEYQQQVNRDIQNTKEQISLLSQKIQALQAEIEQKNIEIEQKQVEADQQYQLFKKRLRSMYMANQTSTLTVLLESENLGDFLSRVEITKRVAQYDSNLVDQINAQREAIEAEKTEVEAKKQEVESAKAAMNEKNARLQSQYNQTSQALADLNAMQANLAADQARIERNRQQLEQELQALYASHKSEGTYDGGKFGWPVPYTRNITSGFGARWGTTHKGIDISAGGVNGQPIVAANAGTVITAKWSNSYGYYVVVDHGGGYSTLYAHCSALLVSYGQQVTRGQKLALVGSTGDSTGPHLHFEVRINGVAKNPLNYL